MVKDLHSNKELGAGVEWMAWGSWHTRERRSRYRDEQGHARECHGVDLYLDDFVDQK